jgi:OmpA-OmpF porin, OOP family
MKFNKQLLALAVAATFSTASYAQSNNSPLYFGVSFGQSKVGSPASAMDLSRETVGNWLGEDYSLGEDFGEGFDTSTSTAGKLYFGYKFNKNFSAELGYSSFGRTNSSYLGQSYYDDVVGEDDAFSTESLTIQNQSHAFFLDLVASTPVSDKFSLFGKLGVANVTTKSKANGVVIVDYDFSSSDELTLGAETTNISTSKSKWVTKAGIGADYQINPTVAIRGEFERYLKVGDSDTNGSESDVDMFTIGLKVNF